jgi:Ca-activated chloride channel family protein
MAKKAGGNYYYIAEPNVIPEIFRAELEKMVATSMTGAKFDLELARWATLRGLTGHQVSPGDRKISVDLADLERGSTLQTVVDLEFTNHPLGFYRVASGRLSYTDSATGLNEMTEIDFIMEFTADQARYSAPVDPDVAAASEISAAGRAVEKTIMGLKTQALTPQGAMAELEKTQALLIQQGRTDEAQEVTLAMQAIQGGDVGGAEKTLMGTMVQLDQGKTKND